jgi:RNA polymerase sigma-70 factor, ECF subfamily
MDTAISITSYALQIPALTKPQCEPTDWEDEVIYSSQRGDLDAFNRLVLAYQDVVFRQAYWMLSEEEAAEDAVQEAFLRAYEKLNSFHGGSFRAWLLRITTNYCLDQIRSTSNHPKLPLEQFNEDGEEIEPNWLKDPRETPEQVMERVETGQRIANAIQRLNPVFRCVVILVDLQELDYAETSTVLHIPVGTVKSRLARARNQLREDLLRNT